MLRRVAQAVSAIGFGAIACSVGSAESPPSPSPQLAPLAVPVAPDAGAPQNDPQGVFEANASNPLNEPGPKFLLASETSMAHVVYQGEHRTVVAYNDNTGLWRILKNAHMNNGVLIPNQTLRSNAGLSVSQDGMNPVSPSTTPWRRIGPLGAPGPGCGQTNCVTLLASDPWLATNGDTNQSAHPTRVLYADLAEINGPGNVVAFKGTADGVAVTASDDGGSTWAAPDNSGVAWSIAAQSANADKESIAYEDSTALVAYAVITGTSSRIAIVTSDDDGTSWSSEAPLTLPPESQSFAYFHSPLVKMPPSGGGGGLPNLHTAAYVAYDARPSPPDFAHDHIRIARIDRAPGATNWQVDSSLAFGANVLLGNGGPGVSPSGASGYWRDSRAFSFSVTLDPGAVPHLWIAYRAAPANGGVSDVHVADCVDSPASACLFSVPGQSNSANWRDRSFAGVPDPGGQFQPSISTTRDGTVVAIIYYNESDPGQPGSPSRTFDMVGAYSTSRGASWSASFNLRPNYVTSMPCTFPAVGPQRCNVPCMQTAASENFYYGDYTSSAIVPNKEVALPDGSSAPWIVGSFSDSSGGCAFQGKGPAFYDQHVEATVW